MAERVKVRIVAPIVGDDATTVIGWAHDGEAYLAPGEADRLIRERVEKLPMRMVARSAFGGPGKPRTETVPRVMVAHDEIDKDRVLSALGAASEEKTG